MPDALIDDIFDYWLGHSVDGPAEAERQRKIWYHGGTEVDAHIQRQFGDAVTRACDGGFETWEKTAKGNAALTILLDQFTRNIFRHSVRAYAGDARAASIADRAVTNGLDNDLPVTACIFLYHPFHHSESLVEQDRAVALMKSLRDTASSEWHDYLTRGIEGFSRHRDVVAQFGRFPHRNAVLGRVSTPVELMYLRDEAQTFGQGPRPIK